jgi:hypothetical protein
MKMNNKGALPVVVVFFIMLGGVTAYLKGNEYLDKEIINKEKWKTQERIVLGHAGQPGAVNEWRDKYSDMIKIAPGSEKPGVVYPDDLQAQSLK